MNWYKWLKHYLFGVEYIAYPFASDTNIAQVKHCSDGKKFISQYDTIWTLNDEDMELYRVGETYGGKKFVYIAKNNDTDIPEDELEPVDDLEYVVKCLKLNRDSREDAEINSINTAIDMVNQVIKSDRKREETA